MKDFLWPIAFFVSAGMPLAEGAFPLNAKKAPQTRQDLIAIQDALQKALPAASAATVCIDMGDGTGSGVIVSADGLIMTAAHVSTGVGKKITITLNDGTKLKGQTLGLVADADAALAKITEPQTSGEPFPFVEIRRDTEPKLGDWIFSLGHSGGFDLKRGVVARLGRLVRIAHSTIQTDGTLIGGDSGGPLFDMDGNLIGIHSRVGPTLPVNMHVPLHVFTENWEKMLESEFIGEGPFAEKPKKGKGFLGIATTPTAGGLRITKVGKDSPAESADLKEGDLLRKLNGEALDTREKLKTILAQLSTGDKLSMEITRDEKETTITLRLGAR